MTPDVSPMLTAPDTVLDERRCRHCQGPLGQSPSPDFCSEDCQDTWQATHTSVTPERTAPEKSSSETTAAGPLGWLGPPHP